MHVLYTKRLVVGAIDTTRSFFFFLSQTEKKIRASDRDELAWLIYLHGRIEDNTARKSVVMISAGFVCMSLRRCVCADLQLSFPLCPSNLTYSDVYEIIKIYSAKLWELFFETYNSHLAKYTFFKRKKNRCKFVLFDVLHGSNYFEEKESYRRNFFSPACWFHANVRRFTCSLWYFVHYRSRRLEIALLVECYYSWEIYDTTVNYRVIKCAPTISRDFLNDALTKMSSNYLFTGFVRPRKIGEAKWIRIQYHEIAAISLCNFYYQIRIYNFSDIFELNLAGNKYRKQKI